MAFRPEPALDPFQDPIFDASGMGSLRSVSCSDGNFNLNTCLDIHNDLFHHLGRSIQTKMVSQPDGVP